mmetsp:Transcript_55111/g.129003  ORF Transcript_55111/g.129003 Transcript_55111/m.129003 type:complete len:310 (-) Transcript_55111:13-942(-)
MYTNRPYDYGSAGKPLPDMERPGAGLPATGKSTRRRLNAVAAGLAAVVPWLLFVVVTFTMCFRVHFVHPVCTIIVDAIVLLVTGFVLWKARAELMWKAPKTWYFFIAISCVIAWCLGIAVGDFIYAVHTKRAYEMQTLNSYPGVDPSTQSGEQVMDAGRIVFVEGTHLDLTRAMGFRNGNLYCVAPIVLEGAEPLTYDYWAVGINCCSGTVSDFHCGAYNNPKAVGGVRLMDDRSRPYYRLAVQQAEAMFGISAAHPLYFEWVEDPVQYVQNFADEGVRVFQVWVWCYLLLQVFAVACACLYFAKEVQL